MKPSIKIANIVVLTALVCASAFAQWGFGRTEVCSMFSTPGANPQNPPVLDIGFGARQVRRIFDLHGARMVPVYTQTGLNNAMAYTGGPEGPFIVYDPKLLNRVFEEYGADASLAILAHECGHIITGVRVPGMIADWTDEARADYFAGWTLGKLGGGRRAIQKWLATEAAMPDYRHPDGMTRLQIIEQGFVQGGGLPFSN